MAKKILIVDDEKSVREAVKVCLEKEGHQLYEAEDASTTLSLAREIKPDLIILDLMLPDKWGYNVCEELKQDPETKNIFIMILTGRRSTPSKKFGDIKGGDDYLVKPFTPAVLREKVRRILG
jgi:two-component system alkaline phosphatase synthesis response regulator PhoP